MKTFFKQYFSKETVMTSFIAGLVILFFLSPFLGCGYSAEEKQAIELERLRTTENQIGRYKYAPYTVVTETLKGGCEVIVFVGKNGGGISAIHSPVCKLHTH
jgi:hypothetical protein